MRHDHKSCALVKSLFRWGSSPILKIIETPSSSQREEAVVWDPTSQCLSRWGALVDRLPVPQQANKRGRGRRQGYSDRLFVQALLIMIVRHLHTVHELLSVMAQPTAPTISALSPEIYRDSWCEYEW